MSETTPFSLSLNQFGTPQFEDFMAKPGESTWLQEKQARVARASEAKRLMMGGTPRDVLATAILEQNDLGMTPLAQEMAYTPVGDIEARYGREIAVQAAALQAEMANVQRTQGLNRTLPTEAKDTAIGVGAGLVGGVGGMVGLATGLVNDEAGAAVARATNTATDWIREGQSNTLQNKRELAGIRSNLDQQDIDAQYEQDVANGVEYAGLKRFGREAMSAAVDLWENPATAGDLVAEGLGSFAASGGLAKVASVGLAKVILKSQGLSATTASRYLATPQGKEFMQGLTVKSMPATIGLLEGGGAYAQIQAEIQEMSETELLEGSEEYRQLRADGVSHEQARNEIANAAALEGGAIQGAVGALTGTLVSKLEANPLGLGASFRRPFSASLKDFGGNILKEATEEGTQSTSGEFVAGMEVQKYADENRDPLQGLGRGTVQGMVAGAGMAGAIRAPRLGLDAATATGRASVGAAASAVKSRVNSVNAARDANSNVGTAATNEALSAAQTSMEAAVNEAATAPESSGNVDPAPAPIMERLETTMQMGKEEIEGTPQAISSIFIKAGTELQDGDAISRMEAIGEVFNALQSGSLDATGQESAALWLHDQAKTIEALKDEDISGLPENVKTAMQTVYKNVDTILENPTITAAIAAAESTVTEAATLPEVTAENVASPEIREITRKQALLAKSNPAGVDPNFIDQLLDQRKAGNIQFSDSVMKRLKAAGDIAKAANAASEEKAVIVKEAEENNKVAGQKKSTLKTVDVVRDEILRKGKGDNYNQYGLSKHLSGIITSLGRGNVVEAQDRLDILGHFAQHMQNKLNAARESYKLGRSSDNAVKYRTWTGTHWADPSSDLANAVYVSPFSPNSMMLAKEIAIDAKTVANLYNNLLDIYKGDLEGKPIQDNSSEVASSFQYRPKNTNEAPIPTTQATYETAPEAVVETAPEARENIEEAVRSNAVQKTVQETTDANAVPVEAAQQTREEVVEEISLVDDGDVVETVTQEVTEEAPVETAAETTQEVVEEAPQETVAEDAPVAEPAEGEAQSAAEANTEIVIEGLTQNNKGQNRFTEAFTLNSDRSLALTNESPVGGILGVLSSISEYLGDLKLSYKVDAAEAKAMGEFVAAEANHLVEKMNARLEQPFLEGKKTSPLAALKKYLAKDKDASGWAMARPLALVDEQTGKYNQRLIEAAALAAVHWAMNRSNNGALDAEEVAKIFNVSEAEVTAEMMFAANNGVTATTARESLAQVITEFWGAQRNKKAPMSDVKGITEGLAAELLVAMEDRLIQKSQITVARQSDVNDPDSSVDVTQPYNVQIKNKKTQKKIQEFGNIRAIVADILKVEREQDYYLNEVPQGEVKRQKGNMIGEVSKKTQDAVQRHRETPFRLNTPFFDLMNALGEERYTKLMGYTEFSEELTHRKHQESLAGKNTNLTNAWKKTHEHVARIMHVAEQLGVSPEEVATYFDWFVALNDRIMAKGFSGQSDKTMREILMSTISILDMTTDEGKAAFWITVAQSLGVKTELSNRRKNINATKKLIREKYPESTKILTEWVKKGGELSSDQADIIQKELGKDASPKALHALLAVARYKHAQKQRGKNLTEFKHSLALEADAKTDGPINAMMHFLAGEFTLGQIRNLRKGGFFPGEVDTTLNQHFETDKEGDLYQTAANALDRRLQGLNRRLKGTPAEAQFQSMMRVLAWAGEIGMKENGDLVIGRNTLKNPLTITIYGSGENGIASKIASAVTDVLYARFSDIIREGAKGNQIDISQLESSADFPTIKEDLSNLFTKRVGFNQEEGKWYVTDKLGRGNARRAVKLVSRGALRDFEFSRDNMAMAVSNLKSMFVEPMTEAIEETTGGARNTTKVLETSTQIRGAIFQEHFRNAVEAELQAARQKGELDENAFLSEEAYNRIYKEMSKYGAVVESVSGSNTDNFHLNLSGSRNTKSDYEFARGFGNEYSGETRLPAPRDVSVSATPLITISRGDARMMINYYASESAELRTLQVYDGLEMAADLIEKVSGEINKASADAWFGTNPVQDEAASFADFLRQNPMNGIGNWQTYQKIWGSLNTMFPGTRKEFDRVYKDAVDTAVKQGMRDPTKMDRPTTKDIRAWDRKISSLVHDKLGERTKNALRGVQDTLSKMGAEIAARKEVLWELGFAADKMASGEVAYSKEGNNAEVFLNDDDLVVALNKRLAEKMKVSSAKDAAKWQRAPVQEPTDDFKKLVDLFRGEDGVALLNTRNLRYVISEMNMTDVQRKIADLMLKNLKEFKVVIGDRKKLTKFRAEHFTDRANAKPIELGQTDLKNGVIYIANEAPETLLHELIHAVTSKMIVQGFTDPDSLSEEQAKAFRNLVNLQQQFLTLDLSQESHGLARAADTAMGEINKYLGEGTPIGDAAAMQEFLAWTLTNQNLAEALKQTKTRSRMEKIKDAVLRGLKRLLGLPEGTSIDMFSNILWNTAAITVLDDSRGVAPSLLLDQLNPAGTPDSRRLNEMAQRFESSIAIHLRNVDARLMRSEDITIRKLANDAVNRVIRDGWDLTPQQASVFRSIQAAFASTMNMDSAALVRTQDVFTEILRKLNVEMFMDGKPGLNEDPADRAAATELYNSLTGKFGTEKDDYGRSNLMATFIALSQVSPKFRKILGDIQVDKAPKIEGESVMDWDGYLTSTANNLMTNLTMKIADGNLKSTDGMQSLDRLALVLAEIEKDDRSLLEKNAHSWLSTGDEKIAGMVGKGADFLTDFAGTPTDRRRTAKDSRSEATRKTIKSTAALVAGLVDKNKAEASAEAMKSILNSLPKIMKPVADVINEILQKTDETEDTISMINRAKFAVSGVRQDYRETLPEVIGEQYSRELSDKEQTALHKALGRTNLSVLVEGRSVRNVREILTDSAIHNRELLAAEEELVRIARNRNVSDAWSRKAKELAYFMIHGTPEAGKNNLLRNSYAIMNLINEPEQGQFGGNINAEAAIERVVALYAVGLLDGQTDMLVSELARKEEAGVEFTLHYLNYLRTQEKAKIQGEVARVNAFEGYIPMEAKVGISLIVRDDRENTQLQALGYTRVGDYKGSGLESGRKGYYFSVVAGNQTFNQGIMQTIHRSVGGIDPRNGQSITGRTAGLIKGQDALRIKKALANGRGSKDGEALMPIYSDSFEIMGYERSLSEDTIRGMHLNTNMGEMIGAWKGRQVEEELGQQLNKELIQNLKTHWDKNKSDGRANEFVDLSDPDLDDPIYVDAWKMVPPETRNQITEVFGDDGFMVRNDLIDNVAGYRSPSVGDAWVGPTRWNDAARNTTKDILTVVLGKDAYKYAVTGEKILQTAVSLAKETIVVKSIIVPASNLASNVLQLMVNGVGLRDMKKGFQTKLVEINHYLANKKRIVELDARIARARNDQVQQRKLLAEKKSIEDANKRMSIWPLVEAGEFSTISEGLTEADAAISEGKYADYIRNIAESAPQTLGTVGRYSMITRDTALFQGMNRAVQYGDFLSKAILYDHMIKREKATHKNAMRKISEEFVNYNYLPGRARSYSESIGLMWFWNFKLRSLKVAHRHLRDHPLRALFSIIGTPWLPDAPGVSVGSPLSDNALSVILDGRAGYSLGPDMLFSAPSLNPWVNITN